MTEKKEKQINKLVEYLWKYKFMYMGGVIVLLLVDFMDLYIPQITGEITDGLTSHTITEDGILLACLKMLGCAVIIMLGRLGYRYFIIGTSRKIERGLQNDLFAKIETLSQRYFNENKTGDLMAYFTNDIEVIREAIGWSVISAFDAMVLTFMCLYRMMVNVSVKLTLFTLIPMSVIGFLSTFAIRAMEARFDEKQEAFAKLSDVVQESITAERVIKAFTQEEKQLEFFKTENEKYRQVNLRLAKLMATMWPIMEVLIGAAYVIAIILGGYYCLIGEITLGKFVTFSSYVGTLVWPMIAFGDSITYFTQGLSAMKRINKVFNEVPEIQDSTEAEEIDTIQGDIRFDHVFFRYKPELDDALKEIDIHIAKGETFALMGRTGAGKTTMVNLLTRIYDTTEGVTYVDGHDIRKLPLSTLRENIAYVPQDNFLFSETIESNISFSKQNASMEEIIEACKTADIHDNIMDFSDKYETMMGERGVTLSGGQKQRVSIARALIKDSPILIMDDSLSAVDTDTEDVILSNLKELRQNKTTIMIAHRVSTVRNADHILFLEDGKMAEYGTYDELMELDGQFAQMAKKQQLESALASEA